MFQVIIHNSRHVFAEFPMLADAAEVGRRLNKKHRHEYCYIWAPHEGRLYRPEYC